MTGDGAGDLGGADALLVDCRGRVVFISDSSPVLAGRNSRDLLGTPCWELMRLHRPDGTPFCGPICPVREQFEIDGSTPRRMRLVRNHEHGTREQVDLVTFGLPLTDGDRALILHLVVPSSAKVARAGPQEDAGSEATAPRTARSASPPDSSANQLDALTGREREVLDALAGGHDTTAIADRLCISPVTVKHHVQNIMGKLGVHRRIDAILAWLKDPVATAASRRDPAAGRVRVRPRRPDTGIERLD